MLKQKRYQRIKEGFEAIFEAAYSVIAHFDLVKIFNIGITPNGRLLFITPFIERRFLYSIISIMDVMFNYAINTIYIIERVEKLIRQKLYRLCLELAVHYVFIKRQD
jgi:hypothetical protein